LRTELRKLEGAFGPIRDWVLDRGKTPETSKFDQTPIKEISEALGKNDHLETFLDITIADDLDTDWYLQFARGVDLAHHKSMADDAYVIPGISDGGAHTKYSTAGNFGTRYLMSYVREHGWHTLEEAHWRLSALPAHCAHLEQDYGTLVIGARADIVVYDFDKLNIGERKKAYDYPAGEWRVTDRGVGYRWVLVNGRVTIDDDCETGAPAGEVVSTQRVHPPVLVAAELSSRRDLQSAEA
jgi:N-acyl-D-aspartate/D-glutamate deacylase